MLIQDVVIGSAVGFTQSTNKEIENKYKNAGDRTLRTVFQIFQVTFASQFATQALQLSRSTVQLPTAMTCGLITLGIAVADYMLQDAEAGLIKSAVRYAHNHIGTLSQIVALVSSLAIAVMGSPALGLASAAFIAYGLAVRGRYITDEYKKYVDLTGVVAMGAFSIMTGNIMGVVGAIFAYKLLKLDQAFANVGRRLFAE